MNSQGAAAGQLPPHSDDVDEELRRIRLALEAVFSPTSTTLPTSPQASGPSSNSQWWHQRQLADRYLTSFQSSQVSWLVCDRLLQDAGLAPAATPQEAMAQQQRTFFAAQTLHTKCRLDAYQLPAASLPSLRDSLLNNLSKYASMGDNALSNRLAMCVSALSVQMAWITIVTDMLGSLAQNHNRAVVILLLKILPEECASDRLVLVDENARYQMRDHLIETSSMVFSFLQDCMRDAEQHELVYEVFYIWIRYVPVAPEVIVHSPLLVMSIQALSEAKHLEVAADAVVEILRMYPSDKRTNQALVEKMIPLLSNLPLDQALQSDDEDVLRAYCRIVTEMGESYMSLILSPNHANATQLVEWVLRCSGIPDIDIANITLNFWYRMVLGLESAEPFDFRQELTDRYSPHLLSLLDACASNLMRYPSDAANIPDDRIDDIKRDRFVVGDTIEDCCRLLGGHAVLQRLGLLLQTECRLIEQNQLLGWQGIEACLACIQHISKFVPSDEREYLPFCFDLVPRLPGNIPELRFTASKTVGKYASWLAMHPPLVQPLLPFLAQGLSVPLCAPAAAIAIKELCECSNQQMSMGEPVLTLYSEITSEPGRLDLRDELEILEGVCRAISRQVQDTHENSAGFVQRFVQPIGHRLAQLVSSPRSTARQIIEEIDRLTVIVRFLTVSTHPTTQQHPIIEIISSTWSLLEAALNRFPQDAAMAEKICRLHKHALRSCGVAVYAPMLNALVDQLIRSYEQSHLSPFLYAASICVTEYGRDPGYTERLFDMIQRLANTSFSFLRNLDDLTRHPDVVEELFYLMGRVMSRCPDPLVISPLLHPLFQCAIVGMKLDHRDANKGTLNFIENTVSYGLSLRETSKPECQVALERVLSIEGQPVVHNLALALMGDLPAYSIGDGQGSIAGILWKLNLLAPSLVGPSMRSALAPVPERTREEFLSALDCGLPREDFNGVVRAFVSACDRQRKIYKMQQHQHQQQ